MLRRLGLTVARRSLCTSSHPTCSRTILAIESSCDDSSAAVVTSDRRVLSHHHYNQQAWHNRHGGVDPLEAARLHNEYIPEVVQKCLHDVDTSSIDFVAVTVKPGLTPSLWEGVHVAAKHARVLNKPLIPVHHMKAHATVVRLHDDSVKYPFLTLLASGGHCLLTLVLSAENHLILGKNLDNAPGECVDKIARAMGILACVKEFSGISGGRAIDILASRAATSPMDTFKMKTDIVNHNHSCSFSFSGVMTRAKRYIAEIEEQSGSRNANDNIEAFASLAHSVQTVIAYQFSERVQRAAHILHDDNSRQQLFGDAELERLPKHLVFSGGCACNAFYRDVLRRLCERYLNMTLVCPPPKLCNDNAVMIAWHAHEMLDSNETTLVHPERIEDEMQANGLLEPQNKCPVGDDLHERVAEMNVVCVPRVPFTFINEER